MLLLWKIYLLPYDVYEVTISVLMMFKSGLMSHGIANLLLVCLIGLFMLHCAS